MEWRYASLIGLVAYGAASLAYASEPAQPPAISNEAHQAIEQMARPSRKIT